MIVTVKLMVPLGSLLHITSTETSPPHAIVMHRIEITMFLKIHVQFPRQDRLTVEMIEIMALSTLLHPIDLMDLNHHPIFGNLGLFLVKFRLLVNFISTLMTITMRER
jgi:hypothetical protein